MPTPLLSPGCPASTHYRKWFPEVGSVSHDGVNSQATQAVVDRSYEAEPDRIEFCPDEPLCWEDAEVPREDAPAAPSSVQTALLSPGVPTSAVMSSWSADQRHAEWCLGEPLCLEDAEICDEVGPWPHMSLSTPQPSPGIPNSTTVRRWLRLELCPRDTNS